jgi:hypothetical protein
MDCCLIFKVEEAEEAELKIMAVSFGYYQISLHFG